MNKIKVPLFHLALKYEYPKTLKELIVKYMKSDTPVVRLRL
jgi:hypothetical protein